MANILIPQQDWAIKALRLPEQVVQQIPRSMKLSVLALFCSAGIAWSAESYAQEAKVSLNAQNETVQTLLDKIEDQSEFSFFFNVRHIDLNRRVSLSAQESDVFNVLDKLFAGTDVTYKVLDRKIILTKADVKEKAPLQNGRTITGKVVDKNGEPVIGANVVVKGTTNGTITDIDGNFSLEAPANAQIVVSYIGYLTQELAVNNQKTLAVSLKEDSQSLDEVVIVGYGSQKKVNLTGAVEQVTSDVFEGRPTANATQMLEGVVPNLNISLADGKPGRTADFNVRGAGSINGGSALVLIDGVEGDPSMLNPADIESVSVLKDAAASAIYGARAPFGVVLITTKNAKEGKPQVVYSSSYNFQSPQNVPDVVSDGYVWAQHFYAAYYGFNQSNPSGINKTQQFSTAWLEEYKRRHETGDFGTVISDGSIGTKGRYVYYPEGTDWYDLLYKDHTFSHNQNLSISGSDGKFDYYLSGRFYKYNGLFDNDTQTDKYKTYNMRFKGGYQATPWLKISNNFEFSQNK